MNDSGSEVCNTTKPATLDPGEETVIAVMLPLLCGLIMLVGVVGNSLVIIVVAVNKHMRSATNLLITNLALADLTFLGIVVPFSAMRYANPAWPGGDLSCKIVKYLLYSTAWGSIYTLVLMSIVRYVAIVFPIMSIKFLHSMKNISVSIIVMWIAILLVNIPSYQHHGKLSYEYSCQERSACTYMVYHNSTTIIPELIEQKKVFYICFFVFGFILPVLIITVLYTFILRALKAGGALKESQTKENLRSKKRATRMVFVVVLAFVVCWLPLQIMLIASTYGSTVPMAWVLFCNVLAFTNSSLNPILYAFLSINFRKGFKKLLCCSKPPKRHLASTTEFSLAPVDETTSCT